MLHNFGGLLGQAGIKYNYTYGFGVIIMNIVEAVYKRNSVRKYVPFNISQKDFEEVETMVKSLPRLYPEIKMDINIVKEGTKIQEILKGIVLGFGKVEAPHYLIITSEKKDGYLENIGFALEELVLKLVAMGIGSCWLGETIKKELYRNIIEFPENQEAVLMVAFGYPANNHDISKKEVGEYRRKSIDEIIIGDYEEIYKDIFNMVRVAPSGVNMQPWRFFIVDGGIDLYAVKGNLLSKRVYSFRELDAGIALKHFEIGCKEKGIKFRIKNLKLEDKKNMKYITSILIEK